MKYVYFLLFFLNLPLNAQECERGDDNSALANLVKDANSTSYNKMRKETYFANLEHGVLEYSIYQLKIDGFDLEIGFSENCSNKIAGIINSLESTFKNEFKCMKELGEHGKNRLDLLKSVLKKDWKTSVNRFNLFQNTVGKWSSSKMTKLATEKPLTIDCFHNRQELGAFGAASPLTSPAYPHLDLVPNEYGQVETVTLFHEMLHLLGYNHNGDTTEMAYSCEFACGGMKAFVDKDSSVKAAKKICEQEYKTSDKKYLKMLFPFIRGNGLDNTVQIPIHCLNNEEDCDELINMSRRVAMALPDEYFTFEK